jgi:hypothetical protein
MLRLLRLPVLAVALLAGAASVRADTTYNVATNAGSGITVKLTSPLTFSPRFGFLPVRVFVENNSETDGIWHFNFTAGSPNEFPGEVGGGIDLTVGSRQNREVWYYVPLALPGAVANEINLNSAPAPGGGRGGGPTLPLIPGVNPAPPGTQSHNVRQMNGRPLNGQLETTFMILQTGPAAALPMIPSASLPPRTTMSVTTPNLTGVVTRTTTITVTGPIPVAAQPSPATSAIGMVQNVARSRLIGAGVPNINRAQISSEIFAGATAGMMDVTVTFRQQGALSQLTVPPQVASSLPSSVVVSIKPVPRSTGTVERVVTYTEAVAVPAGFTPPVRTTAAGAPAPLPAILVRGFGGQNYNLSVELTGPGLPVGARQSLSGSLNAGQGATPPLATSAATDPILRGQFTTISGAAGTPLLTLVDPATVPADWRVWSSFHSVVFTESEFAALDGARQSALRGWVAMGGSLDLVQPDADAAPREQRLGAGVIRSVPALNGRPVADLAPLLHLETAGNGLPERATLDLKETTLGTEVADTGSSATWLITFLLLFAALIGPVNLWVFARGNHRHRLFWTTPALSLLGGLTLALVILVQDGIGGEGQRAAIVALVPGQNQAAIFQEQAARTGYLTQRAFNLADDVLLAGLPVEGIVAPVRRQTREGGRAAGDWFLNRSRQAHLLRQLVPNRGRVEQVGSGANGAPVVESSLPVELKSFVLVDAQGRRWGAPEILPGKATTLTPAPDSARLSAALLGGSAAFSQVLEAVTTDTAGRWMAYGGTSALAPIETLPSITWKESRVAYTGIAETRAGAPATGGAR